MPGQGNHWKALHDDEEYIRKQPPQGCEAGSLVGRWFCGGVVRDIARGEQAACGTVASGSESTRSSERMVRFGAS
ncbi:hypothetical protein [Aromatoleum petrolei]|uniref:Uncharacterized protein n=1 Tax=Aromatoleum petrolei TaxID=76116 RepID=A0ABX1MI89_9RHOO|nr:hypothetical protein [Aromatoleum petrolei]NMF87664.1 hypothetical protein [Aromatoleum petrolei]QTQ38149.1 Uncharacterized protein ToN1_40450 [Aromatoleum petrolei]